MSKVVIDLYFSDIWSSSCLAFYCALIFWYIFISHIPLTFCTWSAHRCKLIYVAGGLWTQNFCKTHNI